MFRIRGKAQIFVVKSPNDRQETLYYKKPTTNQSQIFISHALERVIITTASERFLYTECLATWSPHPLAYFCA